MGGGADLHKGRKVKIYTRAEVAKHNMINDAYIIANGLVCDITQWIPMMPEGKVVQPHQFGKDITDFMNTNYGRDGIMISAPWSIIGVVEQDRKVDNLTTGYDAKNAALVVENQNKAEYTLAEVNKHNTPEDGWVAVQGDILNLTPFLEEHPGGRQVLIALLGRDATDEFRGIHPWDVYRKHAPYLIIGKLKGWEDPLLKKPGKGDKKEDALLEPEDEGFAPGPLGSIFYAAYAILAQVIPTIFSIKNVQFSNDRSGLTRSAVFLMFFMVIHAVGNLHIFLGPDDFNGYGYFYVRLYWTMGGLVEANIVEVYLALAAVLHVMVALKRTWDINRNQTFSSGKLNLAVTGVSLLVFMTLHLQQFRLADTQKYLVRPPPWYYGGINWGGLFQLRLFWSEDESITPVPVRDIYKLEFDLFQSFFWVLFYIIASGIFLAHACWGWAKLVPASSMAIPKYQRNIVTWYGWVLMGLVASCYFSFPLYCYFGSEKQGALGNI